MDLLAALDAFLQEHRRCGDLDGGVDDCVVWMSCECGPGIAHAKSDDSTSKERTCSGNGPTSQANGGSP